MTHGEKKNMDQELSYCLGVKVAQLAFTLLEEVRFL
jgi:hypothetical protein